MRHRKAGRKFGRDTSSRRAMFRNLAANLIAHERIETTDAKAKELRRIAERLITKATRLGKIGYTKQADLSPADKARRLHVSRLLSSYLPRFAVRTDGATVDVVEKVLVELSRRFEGRPGGYTRVIKASIRRGDGAPLSFIEFVDAAPVQDKRAQSTTENATTTAAPVEAAAAAG